MTVQKDIKERNLLICEDINEIMCTKENRVSNTEPRNKISIFILLVMSYVC